MVAQRWRVTLRKSREISVARPPGACRGIPGGAAEFGQSWGTAEQGEIGRGRVAI